MPHSPDDARSGGWRHRDRQVRRHDDPSERAPEAASGGHAPHPADPDPRHPHDPAVRPRAGRAGPEERPEPRDRRGRPDSEPPRHRGDPARRGARTRAGSDEAVGGLDTSRTDAGSIAGAPALGDSFPDLADETQARIYRYVARNPGADADAARDDLDLGLEAFTYHLEVLWQRGLVEERDGGFHPTRVVAATRAPDVPTVVVRQARQPDLDGVVDVMRAVTDERTHVVAESVAEQVAYEETVGRHTGAATRVFFVAVVADRPDGTKRAGQAGSDGTGDDIVGWAHVTMPEIRKLAHTAEVTVGVRDAYRRLGVGGALLERALERAAVGGRLRVYQSLPATNRAAIAFLDAHGWRVEAVRENHYRIDDAFVDEVMMAVEL